MKNETFSTLDSAYGLKTLSPSDMPAGITPLQLHSESDAEKFFSEAAKDSRAATVSAEQAAPASQTQLQVERDDTVYSGTQTKTIPGLNTYLTHGKAAVSYTYHNNPPHKRFISCTGFSADFTGLTAFYDFTVMSYAPNIQDLGCTLSVTFTGKTDFYLLIDGILKLFSRTDTFTVKYDCTDI